MHLYEIQWPPIREVHFAATHPQGWKCDECTVKTPGGKTIVRYGGNKIEEKKSSAIFGDVIFQRSKFSTVRGNTNLAVYFLDKNRHIPGADGAGKIEQLLLHRAPYDTVSRTQRDGVQKGSHYRVFVFLASTECRSFLSNEQTMCGCNV
jgi:hypothetical protein